MTITKINPADVYGPARTIPAPAKRCYLCGHKGFDVTRVLHLHVGGQGEVPFPVCRDKSACMDRMEAERVKEARLESQVQPDGDLISEGYTK